MKLTQILEKIAKDTEGETTTINDVVRKLQSRGFGPLLIAPSLIALLPTGAIPTVPSICGLSILLIVIQMLVGKEHPWLPHKLKEMEVSRDRLKSSVNQFTPYTRRIDKVFKPRLSFLTHEIGKRVIAALAGFTAILMIPLEVLPFAASLPAAAIIFMGVSISTRDGLMALIGIAFSMASLYLVYSQIWQ